jgi:hypothetical protein
MTPWNDMLAGLTSLRKAFVVATLTNASMEGMIGLVKRERLPFDAILTGELVHAFKPDPRVYQLASEYLGFVPGEIMLVSAHKWDLRAAKRSGVRTAFVPRPFENGPGTEVDTLAGVIHRRYRLRFNATRVAPGSRLNRSAGQRSRALTRRSRGLRTSAVGRLADIDRGWADIGNGSGYCRPNADGHFVTFRYVARSSSYRLVSIDVRPQFARTIGAAGRIPDSPWRRFNATC